MSWYFLQNQLLNHWKRPPMTLGRKRKIVNANHGENYAFKQKPPGWILCLLRALTRYYSLGHIFDPLRVSNISSLPNNTSLFNHFSFFLSIYILSIYFYRFFFSFAPLVSLLSYCCFMIFTSVSHHSSWSNRTNRQTNQTKPDSLILIWKKPRVLISMVPEVMSFKWQAHVVHPFHSHLF